MKRDRSFSNPFIGEKSDREDRHQMLLADIVLEGPHSLTFAIDSQRRFTLRIPHSARKAKEADFSKHRFPPVTTSPTLYSVWLKQAAG